MKKNSFNLILSALLTVAAPLMEQAANAQVTGTGTEGDPYVVTSWNDLKEKMEKGGYIRLDADVSDPTKSSDSYLSVPSGKTVTLNLNGHTIDRALTAATSTGYVMNVAGTLTVNDSSSPSTGRITGGWNKSNYGAGIYVNTSATLILNNGSITGNKNEGSSEAKGGGVYVGINATFTMNGGSITNNLVSTSSQSNSASGGGVYVHSYSTGKGTFNMNGGAITGNSVISNNGKAYGGGVLYHNDSAYRADFNLQGNCTITGNIGDSGAASNVYVQSAIVLVGSLDEATRIGVTADNKTQIATPRNNGVSYSLDNFTCDQSGFALETYNGIRIITVGVFVAARAPTCTDTGISQDCWLKDGHYYSDQECTAEIDPVIPPLGHEMTHYPAVAPTETTNGNVEYWKCTRCGKYFLDANGETETSVNDILVGPSVSYIDADGLEKSVSAIILTGSETTLYDGWYVVASDVVFDHSLFVYSDHVRIILADGATLSSGSSGTPLSSDDCFDHNSSNSILSIYGQACGSGTMKLYNSNYNAIYVPAVNIYGGQITAYGSETDHFAGIRGMYNVNIYGGNVTSIGSSGISSSRSICLGWMNSADRITSTATGTDGKSYYLSTTEGTVSVKDGQYLFNGTEVLSGTITNLAKLQNITLQPAVKIILPTGATATGTGVINQTDGTYALPGAAITLGATGYTLSDVSSNDVTINETEGVYSFTMPAKDVTVSATVSQNESLNLTANAATLNGLAKNWCTFYHPSLSYSLPNGAQAFTMKADKGLYLVGDGSEIPAGTPVVIMSDAAAITLTKLDASTMTAESDNILHGTVAETLRTSLITGSQKVYVLGKVGDEFGFYEYTGDTIPANKAYYVE